MEQGFAGAMASQEVHPPNLFAAPPSNSKGDQRHLHLWCCCRRRHQCGLENKFQTELHFPGIDAKTANPSELTRDQTRIGISKLSVVPTVEELCPELHQQALVDSGVFQDRKVPVVNARHLETVSSRIALHMPSGSAGLESWASRSHKGVGT